MGILEVVGAAVLVVLVALLLIFARRELIARRGGTMEMNMRLSTFLPGRGWAPGLGLFTNDELRWYRLFSLGLRPRRILTRRGLQGTARRPPEGAEKLAMPAGWVVGRCAGPGGVIELALADPALMGLLSWLESAPRGALRSA